MGSGGGGGGGVVCVVVVDVDGRRMRRSAGGVVKWLREESHVFSWGGGWMEQPAGRPSVVFGLCLTSYSVVLALTVRTVISK